MALKSAAKLVASDLPRPPPPHTHTAQGQTHVSVTPETHKHAVPRLLFMMPAARPVLACAGSAFGVGP
jgi:hypothetical protein